MFWWFHLGRSVHLTCDKTLLAFQVCPVDIWHTIDSHEFALSGPPDNFWIDSLEVLVPGDRTFFWFSWNIFDSWHWISWGFKMSCWFLNTKRIIELSISDVIRNWIRALLNLCENAIGPEMKHHSCNLVAMAKGICLGRLFGTCEINLDYCV